MRVKKGMAQEEVLAVQQDGDSNRNIEPVQRQQRKSVANEGVPMKERQDRFRDKDQVTQAQKKGKRVEKVDDDGQKDKGEQQNEGEEEGEDDEEQHRFLIPKSEETQLPHKYRPITCLPTTYKLRTGIMTEMMYHHQTQQGGAEADKKGFE